MGVAVREKNAKVGYYLDKGDHLINIAYSVPFFLILVVLIIVSLIVLFGSWPLETIEKSIIENPRKQANMVSLVLICVLFSIYTFALDMTSLHVEMNRGLPSYYKPIKHFVKLNTTCAFFYFFILISPVLLELLYIFILYCCKRAHSHTFFSSLKSITSIYRQQPQAAEENVTEREPLATGNRTNNLCISKCLKNLLSNYIISSYQKKIALYCILLFGSAILSLTAHFPSILMAWVTDPFYASRIALFYGIAIGAYFTTFHFIYILSVRVCNKHQTAGQDRKKCCYVTCIIILLITTAVFVSGVIVIMALFVVAVPVSNSIETAADGISSLYSGAILLLLCWLTGSVGNFLATHFLFLVH